MRRVAQQLNEPVKSRFRAVVFSLFILAIIALSLGYCTHPADAATVSGDRLLIPESGGFTAQAVRLPSRSTTGTCWGFKKWSEVVNTYGSIAYQFGPNLVWCDNVAGTKIVSLPTHICMNGNGFYDYLGCKKTRSAFGYSQLSIFDTWTYHFGTSLFGTTRTPSYDISITPNGHISGTVYYS
jgi:hypothetical protein